MPQILDINTPQVNPVGAPANDYLHIEARPGMFGALKGQALEKFGGDIQKVGSNLVDIAEFQGRVNVDDQVNQWITRKDSLLRGDPTKTIAGPDGQPQPDRGYMGLVGRAPSDTRLDTLKALEESRVQGRNNLSSPLEKLAYDQQTRRMYSVAENDISVHADSQWRNWAGGVNIAGASHELNDFVNNLGNPAGMEGAAHNYINFRVQQAQLKYGNDPKIMDEAEASAKLELLKAHVDAVAVRDPARAIDILESNRKTAGTQFDDMYGKLRTRAAAQTGNEIAVDAITKSRSGGFSQPINGAINNVASRYGIAPNDLARYVQIESGGNPYARTGSYKGLLQMSESEFQRYKPRPDASIWNPVDNLEAGAAKMKAEGDQFAKNFGRDPSAFDSYMIHQQGLGGYSMHLANPNAPAWQNMLATGEGQQKGARWAKQAIWGNIPDQYKMGFGGVDNVTSRDFIAMWAAKFGTAPPPTPGAAAASIGAPPSSGEGSNLGTYAPVSWQFKPHEAPFGNQGRGAYEQASFPVPNVAAAIKPNVIQQILDDPRAKADPQIMAQAIHAANTSLAAQEIAENQGGKAKKEASTAAADGYVQLISTLKHTPHPDWVALTGKITTDPHLDYETRKAMLDRVKHESGEEQQLSYGSGYLEALHGLFSPPGSPGHVNDFSELVLRNDISMAGLDDLRKRVSLVKGDVSQAATQRRVNSFLAGAKADLSFEQDVGPIKIRDPKGEAIYNYQFLPDFVKRADELEDQARRSGDRKKLDEFLSAENVRKMVRQYRNPQEMAVDRMRAMSESSGEPEAAGAPLPPAPEGIAAENWRPIVGAAPISAKTGQPVTHLQWGRALSTLLENPSPQMMSAFNEAYGHAGMRAEDVLKRLNPAAAIAAQMTGHIGAPRAGYDIEPEAGAAQPSADESAPAKAAAPADPELAALQQAENEHARIEGRAPTAITETPAQAHERRRARAQHNLQEMTEHLGAIRPGTPESEAALAAARSKAKTEDERRAKVRKDLLETLPRLP